MSELVCLSCLHNQRGRRNRDVEMCYNCGSDELRSKDIDGEGF
jgi:hypothetical protein